MLHIPRKPVIDLRNSRTDSGNLQIQIGLVGDIQDQPGIIEDTDQIRFGKIGLDKDSGLYFLFLQLSFLPALFLRPRPLQEFPLPDSFPVPPAGRQSDRGYSSWSDLSFPPGDLHPDSSA